MIEDIMTMKVSDQTFIHVTDVNETDIRPDGMTKVDFGL